MKLTFMILMMFVWTASFAKEIKGDFNKVLIETVQKDIAEDNAEELKSKSSAFRGPASVESAEEDIKEDSKTEKFQNQLGPKKW